MMHLLYVAAGGAIGAGSRHLVGLVTLRLFGPSFPWGTLAVNIVGCFLMGVLIEVLALKVSAPAGVRLFLATGVLGGFTTFSAFSLDVAILVERKQALYAGLYVAASVGLSIAALFLAMFVIRSLIS